MDTIRIIRSFLAARRVGHDSRARVLALRQTRLRRTLRHAFDHSPFYRDLWTTAGIKRDDLDTVAIERLPVVTKRQLMEAFPSVVTQRGITKEEVEQFIAEDTGGTGRLRKRFVALNTSGTSGYVGIFLFTRAFWARVIGTLMARLLSPGLRAGIRLAFIGETLGHHAGISLVSSAPRLFITPLAVSESAPPGDIIATLQSFRPTVLAGYAGALTRLAAEQQAGRLMLAPSLVISSGETLTPARQAAIADAFRAPIADLYNATECLAIGIDRPASGTLRMCDDVVLVESADRQGTPVAPGTPGRVILTVFDNDIMPLIRYALDDDIVLEPEDPARGPFTRASRITGRTMEHLEFTIGGRAYTVLPMEFVGLFFPGLQQYQVVQTGPDSVTLRLLVTGLRAQAQATVQTMVGTFLKSIGIPEGGLKVSTEFVDAIAADPRTGKTPIVIPLKRP